MDRSERARLRLNLLLTLTSTLASTSLACAGGPGGASTDASASASASTSSLGDPTGASASVTGESATSSSGSSITEGTTGPSGGETEGSSGTSGDDPTGETGEPPCETGTTGGDEDAAEDYGFATIPPQVTLADTFYTYDLRTHIGACATDRVEWTFEDGPAGARLEIAGTAIALEPGASHQHEGGGAGREAAKIAWPVDDAPACRSLRVRWRAWLDCGLLDDGGWGPEVVQAWPLQVRENHWVSGDLHVHTRHSERGPEAGGVAEYVARMRNEVADDAGTTFADRRRDSPRGRLHWLVFSDHTNNELEECGRDFASWCEEGDPIEVATGREVARQITEAHAGELLLVVGAEISNQFDGHFGFLPRNPYPGHPLYDPDLVGGATEYDDDAGYGPGVFPERWVDPAATNAEELARIDAIGGLSIVNHESAPTFWITYDWSSLDFDGLEVWNGGNRHDRYDDSAYNGEIDLNAVTEGDLLQASIPEVPIERSYLGMLKRGRWPFTLVGGSDVHDFKEVVCYDGPCDPTNAGLASPTTSVWADALVWRSEGGGGVFDGIAAGRVVVHDRSNFIDLRITHGGVERRIGGTIGAYVPGEPLELRAFGRVSDFVDGDNRVLLILGTSGDADDPAVDVLYSSEDATHFVDALKGKDHMRYIRPDSSFDRRWTATIDRGRLGASGTYFVWAQFVPWHNPIYLVGNGQDMALTGAIRVTLEP
ncbi:MAG: hypothetical protein R3B09_21345 [Nannocystaceae bacterium]